MRVGDKLQTGAPKWAFMVVDSLEKVFRDAEPRPMNPSIPYSVFLGETASFQVAFRAPGGTTGRVSVRVDEEVLPFVTLSEVRNMPVTVAFKVRKDEHYLRTTPGSYPDLLLPIPNGEADIHSGEWQAVWFDVKVDSVRASGLCPIPFTVTEIETGEVLFEDTVVIDVYGRSLPPLGIVNTHWLHADAIADYYRVPVFSEDHWEYLENFIGSLVEMQGNSVLTPVWTPPLDTAVGSFRTPVQLMDVRVEGGRYSFEFSKLLRWTEICRRLGIEYLEISHLFSQWGATKAPAIYGLQDGEYRRLFGWETDATSAEYAAFLAAMLPQLIDFLEQNWGIDKVFFHISDEPSRDQRESYRAALEIARKNLAGCNIVDALSDMEFYEEGLVALPAVANDHILPFLEAQASPMWAYYCVAQNVDVSNRFVSLPSSRNRVIGHQLFNFDLDGFLHWGFNFYNTELSARQIDPFDDLCAGGSFPAGDAFMVYPGKGGKPYPSIRYRVFAQAMWDIRAMERLAQLKGREEVKKIIDPDGTLAFDSFSYDPDHYRRIREEINRAIMSN